MCVTYMRRLAQKKNNALLKTMPSAAVTVDGTLCIVECNRNFARLCGAEAEEVYEVLPGLEGARLDRFLPGTELFEAVLHNGARSPIERCASPIRSFVCRSFRSKITTWVGAILLDITDPAMRKQQIVEKSQAVIEKNLENGAADRLSLGRKRLGNGVDPQFNRTLIFRRDAP